MPWNFPFWQVFRFAAPSLAAGNTALFKHAENVFGCAEDIQQLFRDARFPEGVFTGLRIPSDRVEAVIQDERIAAVTVTGSTRAGKAVASAVRLGSDLRKLLWFRTLIEFQGKNLA